MKVLAINRNVQNYYQNINVKEKNIVKADFQNEAETNASNKNIPLCYYVANISFKASAEMIKSAIEFVQGGKVAHLMDLASKDPTVLSYIDENGRSLLHNAVVDLVTERTIPMLKYLLRVPYIDINAQDNDGNTPLITIFSRRKFHERNDKDTYYNNVSAVLSLFMQFKPDVNITNKNGDTVLTTLSTMCQYVDCYGDYGPSEDLLITLLRKLLNREELDINHYNNKGNNALMLAEDKKHYSAVDLLIEELEKREKENRRITFSKENLTPENNIYSEDMITNEALHLIMEGNFEGLKELLENTPLVNFDENSLAMRAALNTKDMQIIEMVVNYKKQQPEMLVKYNEKRKKFFDTTLGTLTYEQLKNSNPVLNTSDGFKVLMNNENFHPNDKVKDKTLFEIACELDSKGGLAKEILSKYDDVDTKSLKDIDNKNIEELIKEYENIGKFNIKLSMISRGLDNPETVNSAKVNFMDLILSIKKGKLLNLKDDDGNNALLVASKIYDSEAINIFDELFCRGFDPNYVNNYGQNCLMIVAENIKGKEDNPEIVKAAIDNLNYLLSKNIDINAVDGKNKQTLFHYICKTKSLDLLKWVLNNNVNVFLPDSEGIRGSKYITTDEMMAAYNEFRDK